MADDLGIGDVTTYNPDKSTSQTVHMDALAKAGMKFTNAHTPSAICSPTRYGIMTGDHPVRAGREAEFQTKYNDVYIKKETRTIGNILKSAGYVTGYVGKWHLGYTVKNADGSIPNGSATDKNITPDWSKGITNHPGDRGFDYAFGHTSSADIPPYKYFDNNNWIDTQSVWITKTEVLADGRADTPADGSNIGTMRSGWADRDWDFNQIQRRLEEKAVEFLKERAGEPEPFFLFLAPSAPHTPHTPHPDIQGKTPHNYTDAVNEVDSMLGAIVAELKTQGILKNTFIVITSDNGANNDSRRINISGKPDHFGTGVLWGVNIKGMKQDAYEGGHRVPFIARWGDGTPEGSTIKPGTENNELINLQDLFRTTATMAGATFADSEGVDSWNMLPAFFGNGQVLPVREAQFSISRKGHWALTKQYPDGSEWKLIFSSGSGGKTGPSGTPVDPTKNFASIDINNLQLFNMKTDWVEKTNVLSDGISSIERSITEELYALMNEYLTSGKSNAKDPNTAKVSVFRDRIQNNQLALNKVWVDKNSSTININLKSNSSESITISLMDIKGNTLSSKNYTKVKGLLKFKVPEKAKGIMILKVKSQHQSLLKRVLL